LTPISLWDLTPKVSGYGLLSGSRCFLRITFCPYLPVLPVTTTLLGCPFAATVCFGLAASTRFLQLPGRSVFSSLLATEVTSWVSSVFLAKSFRRTILQFLAIPPNCSFQLNQNSNPY